MVNGWWFLLLMVLRNLNWWFCNLFCVVMVLRCMWWCLVRMVFVFGWKLIGVIFMRWIRFWIRFRLRIIMFWYCSGVCLIWMSCVLMSGCWILCVFFLRLVNWWWWFVMCFGFWLMLVWLKVVFWFLCFWWFRICVMLVLFGKIRKWWLIMVWLLVVCLRIWMFFVNV